MQEIHTNTLKEAVYNLCIQANTTIDECLYKKIFKQYEKTGSKKLGYILKNVELAYKNSRPLCQDTGQVILFVKIGQNVNLCGEQISQALNSAVEKAYEENYYRKSVVKNAVFNRNNTKTNTPAIIYYEYYSGEEIEINLLVKGAGSENYGALKMFNPADTKEDIFSFIKDAVDKAGERACPPLILGIGAGGTSDLACMLSKKAFFTPMTEEETEFKNELLKYLNNTDIIDAKVLTSSTHIASMPVALTINCHCMRHSGCIINKNGITYTKTDYQPDSLEILDSGIRIHTSETEKIQNLKSGDELLLSGEIYTARDAAHARIAQLIKENKPFPISLKDKIIFYAGPCPAAPNEVIGPVGPTTSARMDNYTELMLNQGVIAMIGKGERSSKTKELLKRHKAKYFTAYGGIACVLSNCVTSSQISAFEELGAEAIYKLQVKDFPLKVD